MDEFIDVQSLKLNPKTWKKLLPYLKPLKGRLFFVLIMMLLSAVVDSVIPLFTLYAVNNFVVAGTTAGIGGFTVLYLAVILFQSMTTVMYGRESMVIEMYMGKALKRDCFLHLQRLPMSYYNKSSVGYVLARVMSDTNRISGIIAWVGAAFMWYIFYFIGMVIAMLSINVKMALIVLSVVPIIVILTLYLQPKMLKANQDMRKANSKITGAFNENINGAKTSKTLVIEEANSQEFKSITQGMYRASLRSTRLNAIFLPLITFFSSLAVAMVLHRSGVMVMNNVMDLGILSAFIAYAIAIIDPLSHAAAFISEILSAQVNIERVMSLLSEPCTIEDSDEIKEEYGDIFDERRSDWEKIEGDIEFENVWFRYPDAGEDDYVLEDINLKIPSGTTVAIVGETGAGKSTMVNLVCRFFEPTQGRILIDGTDYKERSQLWLHSNLGYVQQTPHLFSGSLKENLRYGNLEATDEDICRAAELVSVDTVANKLEKGYDTEVGEGGGRLSTGEKQLVSFGRAVISDPPIFILDEATSSIDTETEGLIQDAISKVLHGRTSFIIAHRLSTIRNADLIILVEGRGISEMGSHDELMAKKGQYYRQYTAMMIKDESDLSGFIK